MAMPRMNRISVIIPTFNEEKLIGRLCDFLAATKEKDERLLECIVVDGASSDHTMDMAKSHGAMVISSTYCSRAIQMNIGAKASQGDILHFIHADVIPPASFVDDVCNAIEDGIDFGCFSYRFDSPSKLLKINSRFTRKDAAIIGGGDQTLFIKRSVFESLNGFNEGNLIMEDYELYWRAKKQFKSKIITNDALVSSRKYARNSYLRVQLANLITFNAYRLGMSQRWLASLYRSMLN
jgi:rSAM/selenodomain-associated transferase 2